MSLYLQVNMGKWQLEVAKMGLYMIFPVASFYAYHQVVTEQLTVLKDGHLILCQDGLFLFKILNLSVAEKMYHIKIN